MVGRNKVALLVIIAALIRIALMFINRNPCLSDECLYGKILDEIVRNKSLVPTYFNEYVPWKPPLTFYVYSLFYPLSTIFPIELTFRIPSLIFGVITTFVFYFFVLELLKNEKKKEEIAFYSSIAYSAHPAFLITNGLFLTDNLLAFLTLLSLLYYLKGERKSKYFIVAGFFSALAFFTKTIMSFAIIYLAIIYYFLKDKKVLLKKEFLISLLFIPATFLLMYFYFGEEFINNFMIDATRLEIPPSVAGMYVLLMLIAISVPFIVFFFIRIVDRIKKKKLGFLEKYFLFWLILIYPAAFSNQLLYWYFIPVIPPIVILGVKEMSKDIFDRPFIITFSCIILIILSLSYVPLSQIDKRFEDQKNIGIYLVNKSNILLLTAYSPGIIYYKFHFEDKNYDENFNVLFANENIDDILEDVLKYEIYKLKTIDYIKAVYGLHIPSKFMAYGTFKKFDYVVIEEELIEDKFKVDEIFKKYGYKLDYQAGLYSVYSVYKRD